jgi:hypothetical protein
LSRKKISYRPSKDKYYPNSLTDNPFVATFVFNRECQRMTRLHQTSIEAQPSLTGYMGMAAAGMIHPAMRLENHQPLRLLTQQP